MKYFMKSKQKINKNIRLQEIPFNFDGLLSRMDHLYSNINIVQYDCSICEK